MPPLPRISKPEESRVVPPLPRIGTEATEDTRAGQVSGPYNTGEPLSVPPLPSIADVRRQMAEEDRQRAIEKVSGIAEKLGVKVEARNLGEGHHGEYSNGVITINADGTNPVTEVFVHELTHHLETSGHYDRLSDMVLRYVATDMKADVESLKSSIISEYAEGGIELDDAGATRELVAKFCESRLFTDETSIERLARTDRNLFQRIYDWIRDTVAKIGADSEDRFLIDAQRMYEKALRTVGEAQSGVSYSIGETDIGTPVAVVDNDILSGIDTSNWDDAKKAQAKKAAKNALIAFKDGVQVNGVTYKVNRTTRREYTRSNDTERLYGKNKEAFTDKMRAADNADDIIIATTSWAQDGSLKHPRNDNFVDFVHGKVLMQAGSSQYEATTVVGITDNGEYVFYDVVDMKPTTFEIKKEPPTTASGMEAIGDIQGSSSRGTISNESRNVKANSYGTSFDEGVKKAGGKTAPANEAEAVRLEIERLSDSEYQQKLLQEGGFDVLAENERIIKRLRKRLDRLENKVPAKSERSVKKSSGANKAPADKETAVKSAPKVYKPTVAKRDLRRELLGFFSVAEGNRGTMGNIIDAYADRLIKSGEISAEDRQWLFDALYESGVMTVQADEFYSYGRSAVKGGRIFVDESIRADFGDHWNDFRKKAFGAGIFLTSDRNDMGPDQWNAN